MEDDIVLNINLDEAPSSKKLTQKGGRWVDRLKLKRAVKRKSRTLPEKRPQSHDTIAVHEPPTKRPRKEQDDGPRSASDTKLTPRPPQIISSLFTFNPKIAAPKPASRTTQANVKPSNAPLDASSFSGLGLHPLLVSHLINKMNIKTPTAIQRSALSILLSLENGSERDAFIQSQTGSGKTLSYLLPIIHDLLPLSLLSYIDRSIGTLAIIIAPTRELAKQISDVLEILLKLRLRQEDDASSSSAEKRMTRWLVSGLLIGGENRTHEKARLRKGIPILVATPGRLLDHLQNTSSFNVGKCQWLVLDEADRLMELGFEETITGILKGLEGRHRLAKKAAEEGKSMEVGSWDWERRRRTILCSATIREDVQKLAGTALMNPFIIKAVGFDKQPELELGKLVDQSTEKFTPPSQLTQKYVVAPLKLRLVALVALLRSLIAQIHGRRGTKIIVFFSCTDSVDFHWSLLTNASMMDGGEDAISDDTDHNEGEIYQKSPQKSHSQDQHGGKCALLPDASIFRLHGSLPTQTRLAIVKSFSGTSKQPDNSSSILLCTSVASRGLDLPLVRAVIQYDLPTEGGATEYVHRVGRTARAGKGGEAWSFVAPSEIDWVNWVEERMRSVKSTGESQDDKGKFSLIPIAIEEILRSGFGGKEQEYEERATEVQLAFERWVLREKKNLQLAQNAFLSFTRAYATHPVNERHIFHIRHLHLGHLAKAFALRESPKTISGAVLGAQKRASKTAHSRTKIQAKNKAAKSNQEAEDEEVDRSGNAERRMQTVVRAQGRLTKKDGIMMSSGVSEFQIAGGDDLEKLVHKHHS